MNLILHKGIQGYYRKKNGNYVISNHYKTGSVLLNKVDSNTKESVSGAEFTIYPHNENTPAAYLIETSKQGVYSITNTSISGKIITTTAVNAKGSSYLQDGQLIYGKYDFKETVTPKGYLPDVDSNNAGIIHQFEIITDGSIIYLSNDILNAGSDSANTQFKNTPMNDGKVVFYKRTTDKKPLSDIKFSLTNQDTDTVKTDTSGTDGKVVFTGLPTGTYTLKEISNSKSSPYVIPSDTWTVKVSMSESGIYSFKISGGKTDSVSYDGSYYTIYNTYKSAPVKLKKVDAKSNELLHGAEFTIYVADTNNIVAYLIEDGKTGIYKLSNKNKAGKKINKPLVNERGSQYLTNSQLIYGSYEFIETISPSNYLPDYKKGTTTKLRHSFEITANKKTIYLNNAVTNAGTTNDSAKFTNTFDTKKAASNASENASTTTTNSSSNSSSSNSNSRNGNSNSISSTSSNGNSTNNNSSNGIATANNHLPKMGYGDSFSMFFVKEVACLFATAIIIVYGGVKLKKQKNKQRR